MVLPGAQAIHRAGVQVANLKPGHGWPRQLHGYGASSPQSTAMAARSSRRLRKRRTS
jgi:hypothetical protein